MGTEEWLETHRLRNHSADNWARGYELIRHSVQTQERIFRMAEQLAARNITGNGFPIFDVLAAADQLASSAMALILQQAGTQANPSLRADGVASANGVPDPATSAFNMVPAYVGCLSINALTGRSRPLVMDGEHGAAAVDAVDRLRAVVADAHLPSGDFLDLADPTSLGPPASRPALVAFLSDGAFEPRKLAALAERWRRGGGKALTPILVNAGSWIRRFGLSQPAAVERFATSLRRDGFDPIVIDGRDPAAFAWAIFEIECRLAAVADAHPCSCHPSEKLVPCAVAVAPPAVTGYEIPDVERSIVPSFKRLLPQGIRDGLPPYSGQEVVSMPLVTEQLTSKGIAFEILFHQPTFQARDEAHRLGIPLSEVVKTILIHTRSGHVLAVIPASRRLDLHVVRQVTGDPHARLATEAEIQHRFPGYELGALPPLGSALDTPVYVDPEVMNHDMIVFATTQSESLRVRTDQALGGEATTIVPLVERNAGPELTAVAEEVELRASTEVEEESELVADTGGFVGHTDVHPEMLDHSQVGLTLNR